MLPTGTLIFANRTLIPSPLFDLMRIAYSPLHFTCANFTLPPGIGIYTNLTNSIHPPLGGSRRSLRRRGEGRLAGWAVFVGRESPPRNFPLPES
ncbi:hypothetical protein Poly59_15040 [Rubripirellula reticaptiva]|uniref:Uncharacterized protein n=1 Tax=Rubripirellula reticaptiva TaxID=2528013 RepID=A0A5C6F426_9BACT|nr:hypothetical protein Poly59_15040 [Rubripirellula reticaptiva]